MRHKMKQKKLLSKTRIMVKFLIQRKKKTLFIIVMEFIQRIKIQFGRRNQPFYSISVYFFPLLLLHIQCSLTTNKLLLVSGWWWFSNWTFETIFFYFVKSMKFLQRVNKQSSKRHNTQRVVKHVVLMLQPKVLLQINWIS